jgi:DNA polymerase-3 subunit gamma/tau
MSDISDSYVVIARRHRPQKFSDLVGQETLVNILKSGLRSGKIGHAFILTGIRGVGKTTIARLLAKSLNCLNLDPETVEPCDTCLSCTSILEDKNMDVMEIDAASRTGVDDIREIIESVQYKPLVSKYKIFIIDEVHMLSKGAFNALLKTLEEPPLHVKFIFATTEIHKIPPTILSRCLKFELKRLSPEVLKPYYAALLQKDAVDIEDEALEMICKVADGSARDGCSLLEQAIGLSKGKITLSQVQEMLGFADNLWTQNIFECFLNGTPHEGILALEEAKLSGNIDPHVLISKFLEICHKKMVDCLREKGQYFGNLARAWQVLNQTAIEMSHSSLVFESLEVGLMKISFLSASGSVENLLRTISKAETVGDVVAIKDVEMPANWQDDVTVQALLQEFPGARVEVLDIEN